MPLLITCRATGSSDPNFAQFELNGTIVNKFSAESHSTSSYDPGYDVVSTPVIERGKTVFLIFSSASIARDDQMRYGCYQGEWNSGSIDDTTLVRVIPEDGKRIVK